MLSPDQLSEVRFGVSFWLKRWYRSPLSYVIEMLGDIPTHQQAQVLKAFEHHNFVAVKSGHGIGKSRLMSWLVNWWLDTRGKKAPITGASGDQISDTIWPEVIEANRRKWSWLSSQYDSTTEELRFKGRPESWKAVLRTARQDNDDALQGFHDCFFFIDEGSGVRDGIFEVASGAMGDPGNFGFMTGNPTKLSGYMYRIFHNRTFWYTMSFSSEDTIAEDEYSYSYVDPFGDIRIIRTKGRQTRKWIENMRLEFGLTSNAYRVRVLGEFANFGKDMLIEGRFIENVFKVPPKSEGLMEKKFKRRMGIDPAYTGEDDTGVVIREGSEILHVESWHGLDTLEVFDRARVLFDEFKCDVVHIDVRGWGAGVYDNFKHAIYRGRVGYPTVRVDCSESAPKDKDASCRKLRDWLWWKSRQFFRTKQVRFSGLESDPDWKQLYDELQWPTYKIRDGKVVVESKDDLKSRGLRSPNLADALNLTYKEDYETFREVYEKPREIAQRYRKKKKKQSSSWKTV